MCLGIPGQIVELETGHEHLARVEVSGVRRVINIGLLEDEQLATGDWVLIHVGFALQKVDEAEAEATIKLLEGMGADYEQELAELRASVIE